MLTWMWMGLAGSKAFPFKLLRLMVLIMGLCWGALFVTLPMGWKGQTILGVLMIAGGVAIGKASESKFITIALMVLSMFATVRYAWWRVGAVATYFTDPSNRWDWFDAACILILLSAETYAFCILFLGFMQTIWPLKRPPVPLPSDEEAWPHVDLLIPTYNEPLSVVRYTALASMNVDWPADKLHIYILDDGKREPFKEFAKAAGIGYVTRSDNAHAKAGNINRALDGLDSPYVAIFDCDHLPTRSFLQVTMGWFLREAKLAMVQTPHHFYSADPFERNLKQFRKIPNEGELFYGVVQDGNDFWNATFFCGSCAVLRRTALDEIGGIAVETVTEDAHTSLRMQMRGWNTAYINIPQAAGLATERLSGHIQQRVRWARGMIQILRTDNPLFAKGLKFAQRICYFNAMTHFLYAVPRLIFLTAPLVYLFFSRSNVPGFWGAILAYAMPHLVLSNVTNSRIQGEHRHSFWNEIYETVLSPYILLPTLIALINPKLGTFNVTAKGGFVEETYFDGKIAIPFVVLMLLNISGLLMVIPRLVHVPGMEHFFDGGHPGTVAMNAVWCVFNLIILGVAITVAREEVQRREQVRIDFVMPARIRLSNGTVVSGQTIDVSIGGTALALPDTFTFSPGEWVTLLLPLRIGDAEMPATIIGREGGMLRLQFEELSLLQQEMLTTILYSRADAWLNWGETREPDRPMRSFYRILRLSMRGMWATAKMLSFGGKKLPVAPVVASRVAPLLLLAFTLGVCSHQAFAERTRSPRAPVPVETTSGFATDLSLRDLGEPGTIQMQGPDSFHGVSFLLPRDQIVDHASLHLVYEFSQTAAQSGKMKVLLNGTVFATVEAVAGPQQVSEQVLPVPAELLVRKNQLTFEFIGRQGGRCDEAHARALWGHIDAGSSLKLTGQRLQLQSTLEQLPLPFLDAEILRQRVIPVVLAKAPSMVAMQAAGVVASYFGMTAEYPVPRFPVRLGDIPAGNVVLVAEASTGMLAGLDVGTVNTPLVALRTNPNDPFGRILIVTGANGDQLLLAAQALALQGADLQGSTSSAGSLMLPPMRSADDAPRWASIQAKAPLWAQTAGTSRDSDGSGPLEIFLRVPPDLYAADRTSLNLHLDYRYTTAGVGPGSTLLVWMNGAAIGSVPLKPKAGLKEASASSTLPLPLVNLRPFSNAIAVQWSIGHKDASGCTAVSGPEFTGSVGSGSYLDLHGLSHWAAMPNLELFSNAGFPFTRFADLSQTTVVLPDVPLPQEIELYFTLLAHFGAQTGYPALRVEVTNAAGVRAGADADLLVIGTGQSDAGVAQFAEQMPLHMDGRQAVLKQATSWLSTIKLAWQKLIARLGDTPQRDEVQALRDALPDASPDALIEGFQSPYAAGRSVVVIQARDANAFEPLMVSFLGAIHSSDISGDVALLQGTTFRSFHAASSTYSLGSRPGLTRLRVELMQGPWFLVLGLIVLSLIWAARMQARLRQMSKVRLHLEEEHS